MPHQQHFYPTRNDISTPEQLERTFKKVFDHLYLLGHQDVKNKQETAVNLDNLARTLTPRNVSNSLQASGSAPLNVENLIGLLAQPQKAGVPDLTAIPSPEDPLSQDTGVVRVKGFLWAFDGVIEPGTWESVFAVGVLDDTHANRLANFAAANYPLGALFYENDRTVWYLNRSVAGVNTWVYVLGAMRGTLSPNQKPTDLGTADTEFRFISTDFDHTYRWTGTVWEQAPGDDRIGQIIFTDSVVAPGTGWQLCNGTATTRATPTGGTSAVTVPDYTTAAYVKAGITATIGPTAPSGLTDTTALTVSSTAAAGTVGSSTTGLTVNSATTGASVSCGSTTCASGAG